MKILIKQAVIVDPSSPFNGQTADIFIENGTIRQVAGSIDMQADEVIDQPGLHVSPGWVDVFAHFSDPGFEFRETLESGAAAAAAGGYTDVMVIPNTSPVLHNKAAVEYITHKSSTLPVQVHPIGAITRNTDGKELAEMYDMRSSGAIAFSDGLHAVQSAGLLVKALQYIKAFNGIIIQVPDDQTINPHGLMHEGVISTRLGLPGKPAMAEELIVARDIKLTRYAESAIHFTGVSTAKSIEYIRRGRDGGTSVSCSVTPAHLYFCDEDLQGYDTNLKINPPLRDPAQREALRNAVRNGWVDCIASHHQPHEKDSKVVEFEYAKFGMISLETAFGVLCTAMPDITPAQWVNLLAINPRRIFGLRNAGIAEGNEACITLFDPAKKWTVNHTGLASKSSNTPFTGKELTGKAAGIIRGNKLVLN